MFKEIKSSKVFQKSLRIFKESNLKIRIGLGLKKVKKSNADLVDSLQIISITDKVIILTTEKYYFIAQLIQVQLTSFGIQSEIIYKEPQLGFSQVFHFVIGASSFEKLPGEYALFQTEKLDSAIPFNTTYLEVVNSAKCIFDYSLANIDVLQKKDVSYRKIFYLPVNLQANLSSEFGDSVDRYLKETQYQFAYYFNRFLLGKGIINFDSFAAALGHVKLDDHFVCLSLPETTSRTLSFAQENRNSRFQVFDGLRHTIGWVGCGLSYKYILHLAKQHQLDYIIVCEDDVEFLEDFDSKLTIILEYLKQNLGKWDVYSGFIADVHREMEVTNIETYKGMEFVYIDKLMSMVFNIYNKSFFDKLKDWDCNNLDNSTNTIDRYIEGMGSLRIVTTLPYLVGHKEELNSSIWKDVQNTVYTGQINKSQELLKNKIGYYKLIKKVKSIF